MLEPRWLVALTLLNLWALWAAHELVAMASTFLLLCAATTTLWRRYGLSGVSYQRVLGRERAQQGDLVSLSVTFGNHKLLPVSLLEIYDTLPRHVAVTGGALRNDAAGWQCLYVARTLPPFARYTRHLQVRCVRRGVHQFGPVRYQAADLLGLTEQRGGDNALHELMVLPKVFTIDFGARDPQQLIGTRRAPKQLLPDPLRKLGVREYRAGDPQRSVDWRATARRSCLMVREIEPSATHALQIILNFRVSSQPTDPVEPDELEFAISVAASFATHASRHAMAVGLCANGACAGKPIVLPSSRAPTQLACLLELLARAASRPISPFTALLRHPDRSLRSASNWLIITDRLDVEEEALLRGAERRGHAVVVILTCATDPCPPVRSSLLRYRVPYQEGWSQRDALSFTV